MKRHAIIGSGFWSHYQLAGWKEVGGIDTVAVCDIDEAKARKLAEKFGISGVYTDVGDMLRKEQLDFVDIITPVQSHISLVRQVAGYGINVICQKPLGESYEECNDLVSYCRERRVKFFVHENFRWQSPIRKVKEVLDSGIIGKVFKARVTFCSAFPVFDNQPALAELDRFILMDIGTHILDVCRFLLGEVRSLHCITKRVNQKIRGEDVASCFLRMADGSHCFAEMSYASILERESFPQTFVLIEGERGSIKLEHDFAVKVTTRSGTKVINASPKQYSWVQPAYAVAQSSIVECNRNLIAGIVGSGKTETTAEDNLKTLALVFGAYTSAENGQLIMLSPEKYEA